MQTELPKVITQAERSPLVSDKYEHINTAKIIGALQRHGFTLQDYSIANVRKEENRHFQKHLVIMKYEELQTKEGAPTIVIRNAHNATSSLQLITGFIRFACSNGLILADGEVQKTAITHNRFWKENLNAAFDAYKKDVEKMQQEHDYMLNKQLTPVELKELLRQSVELRYKIDDVLDPNELNLIRRVEDRGNDLYTTYNRIQESLVHGLFTRAIHHTDDDNKIISTSWSKPKALRAQDEIVRVNQELREIALAI